MIRWDFSVIFSGEGEKRKGFYKHKEGKEIFMTKKVNWRILNYFLYTLENASLHH